MKERHPDQETIQAFLEDRLTGQESLALQRHFFSCPECEEHLIGLLPAPDDPAHDPANDLVDYRPLLRQVLREASPEVERRQARLARERAEAGSLWREIAALEPDAVRQRVAEDVRFHTWGFFELLVDTARRSVLGEPAISEEQLWLALMVTDRLDTAWYGTGAVEAARARVHAYRGNALRVLSSFRLAEQAFLQAEAHLARSSMDPLDEALLLELRGSLRRSQRRFGEALGLLEEAHSLYRAVNEPHLQGRALMTKGLVLQYAGDLLGASRCFRDSLFLLDGLQDPRLVVAGQFNLINCLFDSGSTAEASTLIAESRKLMEAVGARSDLLRLRWLEARILMDLEQTEEAEQAFLEVRSAFTQDRIAFDAALVSLDLAALYTRLGRTAAAERMAREMIPIFQAREVHQEAIAALIVLQRAAEKEQLTVGLVEEVASFLKRAQTEPGVRFRSSNMPQKDSPQKDSPQKD